MEHDEYIKKYCNSAYCRARYKQCWLGEINFHGVRLIPGTWYQWNYRKFEYQEGYSFTRTAQYTGYCDPNFEHPEFITPGGLHESVWPIYTDYTSMKPLDKRPFCIGDIPDLIVRSGWTMDGGDS